MLRLQGHMYRKVENEIKESGLYFLPSVLGRIFSPLPLWFLISF